MKKILNALFVALLAVFTFSSCSDVPAPYEIIDPNNQGGGQGSGAEGSVVFLEETFATSQGDFTIDNKALPEGSKYVWSHKTYEGKAYMYASAFVGGSNKASESWLVSPEVNLTKATSASLTFEHAINKIAGDMKDQMTLWAKESSASDWTQLTIPVYPDGKSWTFVKAGVVDLSAYVGTKMQFALKYLSTTESAGAWEVKNIKLSGEGEKVEDDTPSQGEGMELLTNGGFENWQDGYPLTWKSASSASKATLTESTDKHSGEKSVMVEGSDKSNLRLASQEMTLKPGKYVFSAYFKAATENGASACLGYVPVTADNSAGQYVYGPYVNDITNADWKQGSYSFTLSEETRLCLVVMNAKKPGQNMLVDDASLKTADGGIVEGGEQPGPETPQGSVVFFEETFAQSQGAFTIDNKQLPEGSDHVWAWDSYNEKAYMKASAYVGSAKESESWLISPIVDLTKATKATLTFDHAINKINGDKTHDMTLWVKESKVSEWTQLTIAEYPAGTDWNFVSAGVMDLSAYKGKKMQFAFKYVSSTASCGTWEIKNVKIVGEGEKGEGGGTVEPEPEPQPSGENLLVNPGFEDWTEKLPKAWDSSYNTGEIVKETTIKHGGKNSLKQQSDDSTQKIQQEVTLVGGKKYRISYWFLDNDPKARSRYWFAVLNDNTVIKDLNSTLQQNSGYSEDNAEWQNVVIEFTAPENANKMRYEVRTYRGADAKGTGGGFIYYDDMELVEVK